MGETKWTKEQQMAIETRGCNLLVAAAAGSGKTAVLVQRIINMITDKNSPIDIDRLLVVTFTSAAASEMRERIGEAISKELDKDPSSKLLQRQLTLLNRSNITTMHSFCLDVIKNNFHHIDLDPNFRIADETEGILLKQEVLQEMFEDNYEKKDSCFLQLVEAYGGGKDDKKLQEIVNSLYSFTMSGPWPKKWLNEKAEDFNLPEGFDILSSSWGKVLREASALELLQCKKHILKAMDLCRDTAGLEPYVETFSEDLNLVEALIVALEKGYDDFYYDLRESSFSKIKTVKKDKVSDEQVQEKVKKIRDEVKDRIKDLKEKVFIMPEAQVKEDFKFMYPLIKCLCELVIDFSHRYTQKKKERGIIDYNDMEHYCLQILTSEAEDGKIYPSSIALNLREKFEEVLVDEYQDSNNVQETIINMVSRKFESTPNVFMVGDVKQSIYRFRQAKPELFIEKYKSYSEEESSNSRKILLYKNFRSRDEVIRGVNYIFKQLMSSRVGELDYDDKEALNLGASFKEFEEEEAIVGGELELHILDRSGNKEDEEEDSIEEEMESEDMQVQSDSVTEEELDNMQLEARMVARRIKELINPSEGKEFMVYDKELGDYRPVRYRDIVILLRATANWAQVFTEELGIENIPVYADSSVGYFDTIEIRTMMALLQIIDNPLQDIPMVSLLRSPIFSFTPEELADLRIIDREKYFYETIKDLGEKREDYKEFYNEALLDKCSFVIACIKKWREKSLYMPIDEFIWYLYMDTAYYGYAGAMPNGAQRQANLRILFQRAKQYNETSFSGLFNFINFIQRLRKNSGDMGSAKILGENEDVIRIMSIHKSKGLEFPVVILSGCGKRFNMQDLNNSILLHEDLGIGADYVDIERRLSYGTLLKQAIKRKFKLETLSEEMRVLYVAFTRAKEKLIITGSVDNLEKASGRWCSSASEDMEKVPSSEVAKGNSYLDWIAMALAKHKDGGAIRKEANANIGTTIYDELSTWKVQLWRKNQIIVDKNFETVDEFIGSEEDLGENLEKKYAHIISNRLDWQYPLMYSASIPANISVSDLKRAKLEEEYNGTMIDIIKEPILKKPEFLQEKKGLSPSERGTVVHFVMQYLDLNLVYTIDQIEEQLRKMIDKELITEEEKKVVNARKILNFFNSDLGKRVLNCFKTIGAVYREIPFFTEISSRILDNSLPEEYEKEMVRLQGVIDCFFEEEDGIVLLDYKTDFVEEGKEDEIKKRYAIQIQYYEDALRKLTGKKIKEKYLYLFYNGKILAM